MKPEIEHDNLYDFLFSCIEYVHYFNDITDEQFNKKIDELRENLSLLHQKEVDRWKSNFYAKVSAIEELLKQNEILQEAVDYYNLIQCPKCGHYTLPQYICHNCGYDYTEENYTEDEV